MRKPLIQTTLISLGVFFAAGCAITDYAGWGLHETQAEAKLWGTEVAFSGFGDDDGTYSYTVKYDNTEGPGPVTINSYRNPIVSSFSRDGQIDRDGDDIQGRSGTLGGKFLPYFKAIDNNQFGCEFFDNIVFDKSDLGPGVALCQSAPSEEVDKDMDLQAPVASLDDLFGAIWAGTLRGSFSMEITALNINGATVAVDSFSIYAFAEALRPGKFLIDGSQPSTAALIGAILDNTTHMQPVSLGFVFDGGLTFGLPNGAQVAFNHDVLFGILEN